MLALCQSHIVEYVHIREHDPVPIKKQHNLVVLVPIEIEQRHTALPNEA
jgi:hypothetical protein